MTSDDSGHCYAAKHPFSNLEPIHFEREEAVRTKSRSKYCSAGLCHSDSRVSFKEFEPWPLHLRQQGWQEVAEYAGNWLTDALRTRHRGGSPGKNATLGRSN